MCKSYGGPNSACFVTHDILQCFNSLYNIAFDLQSESWQHMLHWCHHPLCNQSILLKLIPSIFDLYRLYSMLWQIVTQICLNTHCIYRHCVYFVTCSYRVIRIAPFANRLAVNLPPQIQFLRCLANYEALKFVDPILMLARKLVKRMTKNILSSGGEFISVHLRFEEVEYVILIWILSFLFNVQVIFVWNTIVHTFVLLGHGGLLMLCLWWWSSWKNQDGVGTWRRMGR